MAINRFDQPIASQFLNTYVPIPFDQMVQAGAMKQQRYDQSAAAMDQSMNQLASISAMPNSKDEQNRNEAVRKLTGIRDNYSTKDLSNPMVVRQMNNEINQVASPGEIRKWEESAAAWQAGQQHKQKQIARGEYNQWIDDDPANVEGGYDSSTMGTYNYYSPTYKGKEQYLAQVFSGMNKPRVLREDIGDGRSEIGRNQEDIEAIVAQSNQFVTTPWGAQEIEIFKRSKPELAQKLGTDDEIMKNIMRDYAQDRTWNQLTGSRRPIGTQTGGGDPETPFYNEVKAEAEVTNMSARDVGKQGKEKKDAYEAEEERNKQLVAKGADADEIAASDALLENLAEDLELHTAKEEKAVAMADKNYEQQKSDIFKQYTQELVDNGVGGEGEWFRKTSEETLRKADKYIGVSKTPNTSIADDPELNKDAIGFDSFKAVVKYVKANNKINRQRSKNEDAAKEAAFSQSETINNITLHQKKNTAGYIEFPGKDGKKHPTLIDPAVTDQLMKNPSGWDISTDDPDMEGKNDDLEEYIKLARIPESGYVFELSNISKLPNADGSLNLNYILTGSKVGGSGDDEVAVKVKVDEPTQITNVLKQLYTQSGVQGVQEILSNMRYIPQAEAKGSGEYNLLAGTNATVTLENGSYIISIPSINGGTVQVGDAGSKKELGIALSQLDMMLIEKAATK